VKIPCPICGQSVDESSLDTPGSPFPFCSERCKLIDLGRWLDGKYQIPVKDADAEETDLPFESPPER
jgi:endogenous inhibitor of DNA gyrase (YacG/DUF329 family)